MSLHTFDQSITVAVVYGESDLDTVDEATSQISRWDGVDWAALDGCVIDVASKTVTCSTFHFSIFGFFGVARAAAVDSAVTSTNDRGGGSATRYIASVPIVRGLSMDQDGLVVSDVIGAALMLVSTKQDFQGESWQRYRSTYTFPVSIDGPVYFKFRSFDGGETETMIRVPQRVPPPLPSPAPARPAGTSLKKSSPVFSFQRDLRLGMKNMDVIQLQKYLNQHGFVVTKKGPGSPGHENGSFGVLTRDALIRFQKSRHIAAKLGVLDVATRRVINAR